MKYAVLIKDSALRAMRRLPANIRRRIDEKIQALADNPRPAGCVKLAGSTNEWRVRVGDYRVLYVIEENRLIVLIVDVGHRREVYRRL